MSNWSGRRGNRGCGWVRWFIGQTSKGQVVHFEGVGTIGEFELAVQFTIASPRPINTNEN